ncbi:unnamed protein product, partial [Nesidiocoris tenuis]
MPQARGRNFIGESERNYPSDSKLFRTLLRRDGHSRDTFSHGCYPISYEFISRLS